LIHREGDEEMSVGLTEKLLRHLYISRGHSDAEIAAFIGVDRTSIVHLRQSYDIETRKSLGELGVSYVMRKLKSLGYLVKNMNEKDKTSLFDLLVNDHLKIEVITGKEIKGCFTFTLTNNEECKHIESDHRIRLPNGRTRKLYRKTCDFIICVGVKGESVYPFIIPSEAISDQLQTIKIRKTKETKYAHYFKKWGQIKKA
jgi:hypothetical protein